MSIHYEDGSRSPTHTDMDTQSVYESQLNVIKSYFQIDKGISKNSTKMAQDLQLILIWIFNPSTKVS